MNPMNRDPRSNCPSSRRPRVAAVAAVAAVALMPAAQAQLTYAEWGYLPTSGTGKAVYQWQVASWMATYLNDGNRLDRRIDSPVTSFFTQCYGGNWLDSFNGSVGQSLMGKGYDGVAFTNTVAYSANVRSVVSYYHGYHASASSAYLFGLPLNSSKLIHDAGVAGRDSREEPQKQGTSSTLFRGERTWIIGYAGQPESLDHTDLNRIEAASILTPGTTLYRVAPPEQAANSLTLKTAIQNVGQNMQQGDPVHFFVTDHGGYSAGWVQELAAPPGNWRNLAVPFAGGALQGTTPQSMGWLQLALRTPVSLGALAALKISLNGVDLDAAKLVREDPIEGPDGDDTLFHTFRLDLPATILNDRNPAADGRFLQILSFDDRQVGATLDMQWVMLSAGDTIRPFGAPIPEPRTYALMALGLAAVGWAARRRRARG